MAPTSLRLFTEIILVQTAHSLWPVSQQGGKTAALGPLWAREGALWRAPSEPAEGRPRWRPRAPLAQTMLARAL